MCSKTQKGLGWKNEKMPLHGSIVFLHSNALDSFGHLIFKHGVETDGLQRRVTKQMNMRKISSYFYLEVEVAGGFPFILKEQSSFQHLFYVMETLKSPN